MLKEKTWERRTRPRGRGHGRTHRAGKGGRGRGRGSSRGSRLQQMRCHSTPPPPPIRSSRARRRARQTSRGQVSSLQRLATLSLRNPTDERCTRPGQPSVLGILEQPRLTRRQVADKQTLYLPQPPGQSGTDCLILTGISRHTSCSPAEDYSRLEPVPRLHQVQGNDSSQRLDFISGRYAIASHVLRASLVFCVSCREQS